MFTPKFVKHEKNSLFSIDQSGSCLYVCSRYYTLFRRNHH